MERFNINEWVNQVPEQKAFRQAVHTILTAISGTPQLQTTMIMKGGILLALAYESSRYTKDIDFSTEKTLDEFDAEEFIRVFEGALIHSVEELDYGLDCLIQRWKQQPPQSDATFPTIRINVGYANKSEASAHKRLLRKNSSHVVRVDYSLNEPRGEPELFIIEEGKAVQTYSFHGDYNLDKPTSDFHITLRQLEKSAPGDSTDDNAKTSTAFLQ